MNDSSCAFIVAPARENGFPTLDEAAGGNGGIPFMFTSYHGAKSHADWLNGFRNAQIYTVYQIIVSCIYEAINPDNVAVFEEFND